MNILDTIKQYKLKEVAEKKALVPIEFLEKSIFFDTQGVSLKEYLNSSKQVGIIAEFKRKSPSKGFINQNADSAKVSLGYVQAGATALSVLTDVNFFGAKNDDLSMARRLNDCPILRKDFIVDSYQIYEAKSMGADVILLIAAILSPVQIASFTEITHNLKMEVLLEIHNESEWLQNKNTPIDLLGINNRNLDTFEVDIENSKRLIGLLPKEITKIAESGINDIETIRSLKKEGFKGFLIGEYFMKDVNPAEKCKSFIQELKNA